MRLRGISIILAVGLLLLNSCEESVKMVDCETIKNGLLAFDETQQYNGVLDEINNLCVDLKPQITEDDAYGHEENFDILINRLNEGCSTFVVELETYATIKTNPVQSEIKIILLEDNESYIIDIGTPEFDILKATSIHK